MLKTITKGCEPTKGSMYSAAVDLYAAEDVVVGAGESAKVPLGVCIDESELDRAPFWGWPDLDYEDVIWDKSRGSRKFDTSSDFYDYTLKIILK